MSLNKNLSPDQIKFIILRYPYERTAEIAKDYDVNVNRIYNVAKLHGIKKSEEFLNSPKSGRMQKGQCLSPKTQFKKGNSPETKGKRIEAIIKSKEALDAWKKSLFKPGQKPYNTGKNGEIRWRKNPGYYFIRLADNKWELYHRYLWEEQNGPVPDGHNIIFIDGNHHNCKIDNLRCVSGAELAEMNRHTKYPAELRKAIELNNKLKKTIKKYE